MLHDRDGVTLSWKWASANCKRSKDWSYHDVLFSPPFYHSIWKSKTSSFLLHDPTNRLKCTKGNHSITELRFCISFQSACIHFKRKQSVSCFKSIIYKMSILSVSYRIFQSQMSVCCLADFLSSFETWTSSSSTTDILLVASCVRRAILQLFSLVIFSSIPVEMWSSCTMEVQ